MSLCLTFPLSSSFSYECRVRDSSNVLKELQICTQAAEEIGSKLCKPSYKKKFFALVASRSISSSIGRRHCVEGAKMRPMSRKQQKCHSSSVLTLKSSVGVVTIVMPNDLCSAAMISASDFSEWNILWLLSLEGALGWKKSLFDVATLTEVVVLKSSLGLSQTLQYKVKQQWKALKMTIYLYSLT